MFEENVLDKIRYALPVTITAISLQIGNLSEIDNLPTRNYPIPYQKLATYSWEEGYMEQVPEYISSEQEIIIIQNFAINLIKEIKDIPPEFSKVIEDNFWELV